MIISLNWLKEYIDIDLPAGEIADILTSTGLEVENIEHWESVPGGLKGLVVGHVKEKTKHPNADKLSLTKVDIGSGELLSIVCGAPNVEAGQKVVIAPVSTTIYPVQGSPFSIKKATIRGEISQGMICAEDEIGLGDHHDGIMVLDAAAVPGTPVASMLGVAYDTLFEIGLTPNRSDAMSHVGVARDLAAALTARNDESIVYNMPAANDIEGLNHHPISVEVENLSACPRYSGVVIENIQVQPSPAWLQNRLKAAGVRPINNVVDATNFVLKELGQPLHAFDLEKISGNKIVVKNAREGASFVTLDEVNRTLTSSDLMICNAEKEMCIAGVLGGLHSGVADTTTSIFLESAYFNASSIRKTSTHHNLRTDAAQRYEKGADPNMTIIALQRAASLIMQLANGTIGSEIIDIYPHKIEPYTVSLRYARLSALAGQPIDQKLVKEILRALEIDIVKEENDVLQLHVPVYRADVQREIDVIEEILRIYGFNQIDIPSKVNASLSFTEPLSAHDFEEKTASILNGLGFSEIITNSITKSSFYDEAVQDQLIHLENSMTAELDVLRSTPVYSGLEVIAHNLNRKTTDVKLFEFGHVYSKGNHQSKYLSLFVSGDFYSKNWIQQDQKTSFYHLKGVLTEIMNYFQLPLTGTVSSIENNNSLLSYQLDLVSLEETPLASIGKIDAAVCNRFDINQDVFYAEVRIDEVHSLLTQRKTQFKKIPKYPSVSRDLALIVDDSVSFQELKQVAQQQGGKYMCGIDLFDIYKDPDRVGKGKKSYALSFTLLNEQKTMTDKEIDRILRRIIASFEKEFDATIRK